MGDATTSVATRVVAVGEATEISVGDGTAMVGVLLAAGVLLGGGVSLGATVRLAVSVASGAAGVTAGAQEASSWTSNINWSGKVQGLVFIFLPTLLFRRGDDRVV
jgi:hypothetical protein